MNAIKIRRGIYETNSSSSHSIAMGPEGRFEAHLEDCGSGLVHVSGVDWNTSESRTNDPQKKLSYLLTLAWTLSMYEDEEGEEIVNQEIFDKYLTVIKKVVLDFTGLEIDYDNKFCTIDHASVDIIDPRDISNPEFIKEFVFNPETWLYTNWDWTIISENFYKHKKKTLFTLCFDLPGKLGTRKLDVPDINVEEEVCDGLDRLFSDIGYSKKEGVFKLQAEDPDLIKHSGHMFFGDYLLTPSIEFPDDN